MVLGFPLSHCRPSPRGRNHAANLLGRRFLGIDQEEKFLEMSKTRREELNGIKRRRELLEKLNKQAKLFQDSDIRVFNEPEA